MSFYASSNDFMKTYDDTYLDTCNENTNLSNMEKGDNLSSLNKVILYLYRYNAYNSECNELRFGSPFTFLQNLKGVFLLPGDFLLPRIHFLFYQEAFGSVFLKYGYFCPSMDIYNNKGPQTIENLATITKSDNKQMLFCFNPNYYLSYILSFILWGIIFILIYNKVDEDKNI